MRLRLRPVESSFYDLFADSAAHLVEGAALVLQILEPDADRAEIGKRMRQVEHEADETTHRIVSLVNRTFVTPFDREDIYSLASGLDDVMDYMDEVVDEIVLYEVDELPPKFAKQAEVLRQGCQLTADAMPRLRSMKDLEEFWIEINRLENEGDRNHRRSLKDLFSGNFKAMQVLALKDIAETIEAAIDALEHVANVVERIATKES